MFYGCVCSPTIIKLYFTNTILSHLALDQAKLIHILSSPLMCFYKQSNIFLIHYSSLNNHFPDSVYV